jgi:uncharacterized lipoprotein YehR (DUF1307 family)
MKYRVNLISFYFTDIKQYYPQFKNNSIWKDMTSYDWMTGIEYPLAFDTKEEAIKCIEDWNTLYKNKEVIDKIDYIEQKKLCGIYVILFIFAIPVILSIIISIIVFLK